MDALPPCTDEELTDVRRKVVDNHRFPIPLMAKCLNTGKDTALTVLLLGGEEKAVHKICTSCINNGVGPGTDFVLSGHSVPGRGLRVKKSVQVISRGVLHTTEKSDSAEWEEKKVAETDKVMI